MPVTIAVAGEVILRTVVPTWREMCQVKDACWDPDDVVIQLHPARRDYINVHASVLHLWRALDQLQPLPPKVCV